MLMKTLAFNEHVQHLSKTLIKRVGVLWSIKNIFL